MLLIKPYYKFLAASNLTLSLPYDYTKNQLDLIEYAGKICYKSENNITNNSTNNFVNKLINNKHFSVLEHSWELRVYPHLIIPTNSKFLNYLKLPHGIGYVVAGNMRAFNEWEFSEKDNFIYPDEETIQYLNHRRRLDMFSVTVLFITNRGISHELVRHRVASFSQESTRWCNYSKDKFDNNLTFIIPLWAYDEVKEGIYKGNEEFVSDEIQLWFGAMSNVEINYLNLINRYNFKPDRARAVLPNDLKTEIIITANLAEWKHIFELRGTPECHSHEQMKELMIPLHEDFKKIYPGIF
ncbi:MAG: FAD-dependent thymidylate synthase [Sphaerochaetaceae bacterium]|nr:FAD-dependent thymidylate synthase [Sphaerochaetaceae bacterium]